MTPTSYHCYLRQVMRFLSLTFSLLDKDRHNNRAHAFKVLERDSGTYCAINISYDYYYYYQKSLQRGAPEPGTQQQLPFLEHLLHTCQAVSVGKERIRREERKRKEGNVALNCCYHLEQLTLKEEALLHLEFARTKEKLTRNKVSQKIPSWMC